MRISRSGSETAPIERRMPAVARRTTSLGGISTNEKRRLIAGHWVEKVGERRRRFYKLTPEGREVLKSQRNFWAGFVDALTAGGPGLSSGSGPTCRGPRPRRRCTPPAPGAASSA